MPGKKYDNKKKITSSVIRTCEENEAYAQVTKELGCCRLQLICEGGKIMQGIIRGGMRKIKSSRIFVGDIVIIKLNENPVWIKDKCSREEVKELKRNKQLEFANFDKKEIETTNIQFGEENDETQEKLETPNVAVIKERNKEIFDEDGLEINTNHINNENLQDFIDGI